MSKKNYYLKRDSKSGEITYMEFDKIKGYNITPKSDIYDGIKVDKIVFLNPSFSEKIIKKKIDIKIRKLLRELKTINEDDDEGTSADSIRETLMEAERLKLNIIKNYCKYLGIDYQTLTLKKIQIIINQLRIRLYNTMNRKRNILNELFYLEEEEYRGRSR